MQSPRECFVYFFYIIYNQLNHQSQIVMKSQATKIKPRSEKRFLNIFSLICKNAWGYLTLNKTRLISPQFISCCAAIVLVALGLVATNNYSTQSRNTEVISLDISTNLSGEQSASITPAITTTTSDSIQELSEESIEIAIDIEPIDLPEDPLANLTQQVVTVRSGDSLSLIFDRSGFTPRQLYEVVSQSEHGDNFGRLLPGKEITFYANDAGELIQLSYQVTPLQSYVANKTESGYKSELIVREPESYLVVKAGEIESSFYVAGLNSGLSDNLIMQLAGIFGWDIDFALEIRKSDTFSVVYEDRYLDGESIGEGNILAAEFVNQGRTYQAIRHTDSEGRSAYYTPEGESMRKAFLRTPLDIFWISSHFNPNRRHPILNTIRAHNGTDYAANTGTPVKATGDGRITSARYSSSYGNVIEIQHGQNYKTLYAHLNGFARGISTGDTVQQGEVIGYVGMTGLASGPHLHFEFHHNGVVKNPVTVDLPNGAPLSAEELPEFQQVASSMIELLDNPAFQYAEESAPTPAPDQI